LLDETIQYFEKSIEEEAAKEADPQYSARKRLALEAQWEADDEFDYACEHFPVGLNERQESFLRLNLADKAVCAFAL